MIVSQWTKTFDRDSCALNPSSRLCVWCVICVILSYHDAIKFLILMSLISSNACFIHIPVFYCIICKCHQPSPYSGLSMISLLAHLRMHSHGEFSLKNDGIVSLHFITSKSLKCMASSGVSHSFNIHPEPPDRGSYHPLLGTKWLRSYPEIQLPMGQHLPSHYEWLSSHPSRFLKLSRALAWLHSPKKSKNQISKIKS